MKKYLYCFLLFIAACALSAAAVYAIVRFNIRQEQPIPNTVIETETVRDDDQMAANQEGIRPVLDSGGREYCLVSEAGFLLVFCRDEKAICLYTHIPVTDFPEQERERLMEGIWFPSMMEVYNYLESYTS